jgi:hypothetical protein
MTELDDALNEILFEAFVEHFSLKAKRKLRIVESHFEKEHEEIVGRYSYRKTRIKRQSGGLIWRYYKTNKRFIWGGIKIPEIKAEHWTFYINSPGWGAASKKFHLGDPKLFETIEKWFDKFAAKRPGKRWRDHHERS